VNQKKIQKNKK